jgi:hypothetical protein
MPAPGADVVTRLNSAVAALTSGTNLFEGPVRPPRATVPATAVFVLATGGPPPEPYLGQGIDWRVSNVQATVRGEVGAGFAAGQTLARSVLDAIQRGGLSGYVRVLVVESEPTYLGQDENGHYLWTVNARLGWDG